MVFILRVLVACIFLAACAKQPGPRVMGPVRPVPLPEHVAEPVDEGFGWPVAAPDPPAPTSSGSTDVFQPVVQEMPRRCEISGEPIDTDPVKPSWCTAAALPIGSDAEQREVAKILGEHRYTFESAEYAGDGESDEWTPYTAVDELDVTRNVDGAVHFAVSLNFVNAHSCAFSGSLEVLGPNKYRISEGNCHLLAELQHKRIEFINECPSDCATSSSCGARGGFRSSGINLGHTREQRRAR